MQQHYGDDHRYWCIIFVSRGPDFTEGDLTAVRTAVELPGVHARQERLLQLLDQPDRSTRRFRGSWDHSDGRSRTNRISVSSMQGQQLGLAVLAYRVLARRYPSARFTMQESFLRKSLIEEGLTIVASQ